MVLLVGCIRKAESRRAKNRLCSSRKMRERNAGSLFCLSSMESISGNYPIPGYASRQRAVVKSASRTKRLKNLKLVPFSTDDLSPPNTIRIINIIICTTWNSIVILLMIRTLYLKHMVQNFNVNNDNKNTFFIIINNNNRALAY